MNKTKIPWCDYTLNPIKGLCPMACEYCYARRMYKRFKWDPTIRYDDWVWQEGGNIPSGSKTFVGSTMELFGEWVKPEWLELIFDYCKSASAHTFIFLTKKPENLIKSSPFPDNCYVGFSADTKKRMVDGYKHLCGIDAKVKYISFEPLLERMDVKSLNSIEWVIIGRQTPPSKKTGPKIEWIREIVEACDKAGIPVFLKDNLWDLLYSQAWDDDIFWATDKAKLRQEFPGVESDI